MKVMITGAGTPLGQALIRSLLHSSLEATTVAVDSDPWAAGLRWADAADWLPAPDDDHFRRRFEELLVVERPDAVLIGDRKQIPFIATHRRRLEAISGARFVTSSQAVVETTHDRWQCRRFLIEAGVACPRCCLAGGEDRLLDEVGFPLIVKSRFGSDRRSVRRVDDYGQLRAALLRRRDEELIVEEYVGVSDEEYCAGALVFAGRCRASVIMRRETENGVTRRAFVGKFPEFQDEIRSIAESFRPFGPLQLEFRVDHRGIRVFDVHARFSEATFLRSLAGFNEVEMTLEHLFDNIPAVQPPIEQTTVLRHWAETVIRQDEDDQHVPGRRAMSYNP